MSVVVCVAGGRETDNSPVASPLARPAVQWRVVSQHDLGANSKQLGVVMIIMLFVVLVVTVTWASHSSILRTGQEASRSWLRHPS